ncbi:hypothetical protein KIW84_041419 [Lathyrus oleraceus]|uniref:Uncharacterized protein n=1 Tax=Pisum sativum TaxID=3888 RepID=A0A9D5ALA0_PEA|nr:hypothetical protein KIW84_041419 [Pisum sativum]
MSYAQLLSQKELLHGYTGSICPRKQGLSGIPFCHVIACIWNIKKHPEDYAIACYRKPTFMDTYSNIVYPANESQLCPVDDLNTMASLVMRRSIGRPKNRGTR